MYSGMYPKTEYSDLLDDVSKEMGGRGFKYKVKIVKTIVPVARKIL